MVNCKATGRVLNTCKTFDNYLNNFVRVLSLYKIEITPKSLLNKIAREYFKKNFDLKKQICPSPLLKQCLYKQKNKKKDISSAFTLNEISHIPHVSDFKLLQNLSTGFLKMRNRTLNRINPRLRLNTSDPKPVIEYYEDLIGDINSGEFEKFREHRRRGPRGKRHLSSSSRETLLQSPMTPRLSDMTPPENINYSPANANSFDFQPISNANETSAYSPIESTTPPQNFVHSSSSNNSNSGLINLMSPQERARTASMSPQKRNSSTVQTARSRSLSLPKSSEKLDGASRNRIGTKRQTMNWKTADRDQAGSSKILSPSRTVLRQNLHNPKRVNDRPLDSQRPYNKIKGDPFLTLVKRAANRDNLPVVNLPGTKSKKYTSTLPRTVSRRPRYSPNREASTSTTTRTKKRVGGSKTTRAETTQNRKTAEPKAKKVLFATPTVKKK